MEAEDIVQSVFGSFFRRVGQGYYDVPDGDELWKLLLVIALHKIREQGHLPSRGQARRAPDHRRRRGSATPGIAGGCRASPSMAYLELVVEEILERLPPQSRVMVKLRIEGYEVAEVARMTGRSRRSVERILQESRLKLGELLQKED